MNNELEIEFSNMVAALAKQGENILFELTPIQADLWHMATGVAGEAGELLDAVKKHVIYQKDLDKENMIEELGDLEFYMERIRKILGVTRGEILSHNLNKLLKGKNARYSEGSYSNNQAKKRADKE